MSFGFVEGFKMGSSVVDTYLRVKKDREDRDHEEDMKNKELLARAKEEERKYLQKQAELEQKHADNIKASFQQAQGTFTTTVLKNPQAAVDFWNGVSNDRGFGQKKAIVELNGNKHILDFADADALIVDELAADIKTYKGKGLYTIDEAGIVERRGSAAEEFKPTGVRAVDIRMYQSAEEEDKSGEYYSVNGKVGVYSKQQLKEATQNGMQVRKVATPTAGASYSPTSEEKNLAFFKRENAGLKQSSPEEYNKKLAEFKQGLFDSITSGKGFVKDDRTGKQIEKNISTAVDDFSDYYMNPVSFTDKKVQNKARFIQRQNLSDSGVHTPEVKEDLKRLRGNKMVIDSIDAVLSNPSTAKVETDVAEKSIDWVNKTSGRETADTLRNVDFNTKTGRILFTFINSLSGSAYTASEIEAYKGILLGGNLSDEKYVIPAIESFRESIVNENETVGDRVFPVAPYDAIQNRKYSKTSPFKREEINADKTKKVMPMRTINGVTKRWDGTKWID